MKIYKQDIHQDLSEMLYNQLRSEVEYYTWEKIIIMLRASPHSVQPLLMETLKDFDEDL